MSTKCIEQSVERVVSVLNHYSSLQGNEADNDYSHLRDLITDIMHYVTEKNLGNGPDELLIGASEVYQTEQQECDPED